PARGCGTSCRSTAPGAKAEPGHNPEPAPIAPGAGAPTVQSTPRRHAAAGISCRSTAPGAEAEPSQNTKPPPIAPGAGAPTVQSAPRRHAAMGISCRSTAPVRNGAQPKHRASPNRTRVGCSYGSEHAPANTPLWAFHVGAPPPVRKRSQARTPSHPRSHPGRVLLQPVTPGGDPAQSTIAAAQPKAISGRL